MTEEIDRTIEPYNSDTATEDQSEPSAKTKPRSATDDIDVGDGPWDIPATSGPGQVW